MKSFKRSTRGLSPIFATLILIAIAVIAGIVVYMFTSGYIGSMTTGGTAAQEKAAVQGVGGVTTSGASAYASYVSGGNSIFINGAIIKDASGATQVGTVSTAVELTTDGALKTVPITGVTLVTGHTYTLTLTSTKGGSFASGNFNCP